MDACIRGEDIVAPYMYHMYVHVCMFVDSYFSIMIGKFF